MWQFDFFWQRTISSLIFQKSCTHLSYFWQWLLRLLPWTLQRPVLAFCYFVCMIFGWSVHRLRIVHTGHVWHLEVWFFHWCCGCRESTLVDVRFCGFFSLTILSFDEIFGSLLKNIFFTILISWPKLDRHFLYIKDGKKRKKSSRRCCILNKRKF